MIRPKAISQVLQQAITGDVGLCMLITKEGNIVAMAKADDFSFRRLRVNAGATTSKSRKYPDEDFDYEDNDGNSSGGQGPTSLYLNNRQGLLNGDAENATDSTALEEGEEEAAPHSSGTQAKAPDSPGTRQAKYLARLNQGAVVMDYAEYAKSPAGRESALNEQRYRAEQKAEAKKKKSSSSSSGVKGQDSASQGLRMRQVADTANVVSLHEYIAEGSILHANIWRAYCRMGKMLQGSDTPEYQNELNMILIECELGTTMVVPVHNLLLFILGRGKESAGVLRAKIKTIKHYLDEVLQSVPI